MDTSEPEPGPSFFGKAFNKLKSALTPSPKTNQDLADIIDQANEDKVIDDDTKRIIEGALEVSETQVREIMVPRTQVNMLRLNASFQDNLDTILETGHSRYPVIDDNVDDVAGILLTKDLLHIIAERNQQLHGKNDEGQARDAANILDSDLLSVLRPPFFVPETKRIDKLLNQFRENRNHLAVVIDEYGKVAGIVTIEDVLEEIVGEIEDEYDTDKTQEIRRMSQSTYIINAQTQLETFNEKFEANFDEDEFDTIGGVVTRQLGRLPKRNEETTVGRFFFKVMKADSRRLATLRVTVLPENEATEENHQTDELASPRAAEA